MTIKALHDLFIASHGICTDTRKIEPGTLFFALKGENFNGNAFALKALAEGCVGAVVDEGDLNNEKIIRVESVLKTLQDLALYHRRQFSIPILGITGSNGKTTTKELIGEVLKTSFNVLVTKGNLNNHLGVPFTLLGLKPEHELAIIEMGANKLGDIKELAEIAEPTHGIITNIGAAHIEGFGSLEGVVQTKTELYRNIRENKGVLFVNASDDLLVKHLPESLEIVRYGNGEKAIVQADIKALTPYLVLNWGIGAERNNVIESKLVGSYNLDNFLAAICIGNYFGVSADKINAALTNYVPSNNRSQITKTEKNTLVVDCYNANATSMKAAIDNFDAIVNPNKWLILGSMKELGTISETEHHKIYIQAKNSDCKLVLIGQEFASCGHDSWFERVEDFMNSDRVSEIDSALVLLKGSRSIGLEKLIPLL